MTDKTISRLNSWKKLVKKTLPRLMRIPFRQDEYTHPQIFAVDKNNI